MMDKFVNLHVHSTYSFLDGLGHPKEYVARAVELGQIALGITDHGNVSSHYKWNKECRKAGITPLLGCELYIQSSESDFKSYEHMTCLAINNEGYANLLKIVTEGWKRGGKHPIVPLELVLKHQKGLVLTSGCPSGRLIKMLLNEQEAEAKKYLKRMSQLVDNFYIEVSPWNFTSDKGIDYRQFVPKMHKLARELKIPLVATSDCHYVREGQDKVQEILLCIQRGDKMSNQNRWKFDTTDLYLKSREEMERDFKAISKLNFSEAFDNTVKIAQMVNFEFPTASALKVDTGMFDKVQIFKEMVWTGMKKKKLDKNKEYIERTKYEVELIIKKGFVDYFLIVADMCQWAKNRGILVGPARGSAAGSLVCFLLRITEVDPLKYGLMFERFIDINREDFPDIDVDFEDRYRHDVIKHLEDKYGEDKVCHIATFATFKGKNTIQEFGKAFEMPMKLAADLSALIIERSGGDSRASFTIMDSLKQFDLAKDALKQYPQLELATQIEGQLKNLSSHASGIIITNEPLENFCAIYRMKGEDGDSDKTSSMDYYDASGMGLMKLDVLGLNTLSCIHKAVDLVRQNHGVEIDLYNMELEDPKVYEGFRDEKKLFGIFQFDGQAVNQVCRQIQPQCFEDLSAINALSRPGPMHGMDLELQKPVTTIYIERRNGKLPAGTAHPLLKGITGDTQGVVIYQEQVMKVMREIGLMSWKDTADIRKNISRSRGVEAFNEFKVKFSEGAKKNGLSDHEIDNIWGAVCTFGSWAFNKSHSISYSVISYWTMYFKVYYPTEYFCAMASVMNREDKVKRILKEFVRGGGEILPLDVNKSKETFTIEAPMKIRLGFDSIKGMGYKTGERIAMLQPYRNLEEFQKKNNDYNKSSPNSKIAMERYTKLLAKLGAFKTIGGASLKVDTLFGVWNGKTYDETLTFEEQMKLCPFSVQLNVVEEWEPIIRKYIKMPLEKIEHLDPTRESQMVAGIIYDKNLKDKIEEAITRGKSAPILKDGLTKYCNFIMEDDTDFVTMRVATRNFEKFKKLIFEETKPTDVLLIKGRMGDGIRMFFVNEIVNLTHFKERLLRKARHDEYTESEQLLTGLIQPKRKWRSSY